MFRYLTAGESHGPCLTLIMEGLPAGISLDIQQINEQLSRRQQGYGRGGRMAIEKDEVEVLSGLRFGQTLGSPLTLQIKNRDWQNWQERMAPVGPETGSQVTAPRPGHADLTGILKYDRYDVRDILERASARETAARVAAGAVATQVLANFDIQVGSHVTKIGGVGISRSVKWDDLVHKSDLGCVDQEASETMKEAIRKAKSEGDTLGGIFEVLVKGLIPGLGSHVQWDRRLDSKLGAALMSIPAIKGVEMGAGFQYADLPGSQLHDEIYYDDHYYRSTNRAGGLEGGMSNGEMLVLRAVMKPIPTLMKPLNTVDITNHAPLKASTERSDVCAVTAAAVVGEAMVSLVLCEALLEKFGGDCLADLKASVEQYLVRISQR